MRVRSTAARGVLAGLAAAAAVAIWFLAIDTVNSQPFRTPVFLASALLGIADATPDTVLLAIYSIAHFAVFTAIGVATAWLLGRAGVRPHFLIGCLLGILLFDLIFYAGVIVAGSDVVRALGWPEVFAGSMLGGIVLIAGLALTSDVPTPSWREKLREHRVVREALVSGLLGAATVAVWFLIIDVAQGRLFFTPAALGSALFYGASGAAAVQIGAATVLGYTGIHIAAFLIVGFVASAIADASERQPALLLGAVLLFVTFEALFLGLVAVAAGWLLDALQWWAIVIANAIAALTMGGYLWHEHPLLREEATHELEEQLSRQG
jgi:hypothetical protein